MSRCIIILGLVFTLCLAGCAPLSTDPKLVGTYSATNSETLIFMADARVFHTEIVNGKEEKFFLGYYTSASNNAGQLGFVGPDTSEFVGTSFQASKDFSTVTASWNNFRKPKDLWQVMYHTTAKTN
ncbi:MAG: hypothetical protein PHY43_15905 [Verrucomicrobiales bacterium]|nr:hypothetical protein [Verrucomicrobiales bacterium]